MQTDKSRFRYWLCKCLQIKQLQMVMDDKEEVAAQRCGSTPSNGRRRDGRIWFAVFLLELMTLKDSQSFPCQWNRSDRTSLTPRSTDRGSERCNISHCINLITPKITFYFGTGPTKTLQNSSKNWWETPKTDWDPRPLECLTFWKEVSDSGTKF